MLKKIILLICLIGVVLGEEIVVIGDKNFPKDSLTIQEIRAIFLDKKHFIGEQKVLAMNYKFNHPLRLCFERNILNKGERSLERYWRKAYYKGRRPPKIIKSKSMLFAYFDCVHPSIGYSDFNSTIGKNMKILYRVECL